MANPFAYEEYRKDKIRQKIEESRTQRVQVKVRKDVSSSLKWSQLKCLDHDFPSKANFISFQLSFCFTAVVPC